MEKHKRFCPLQLQQWTQGQWTRSPLNDIQNFCFDTRSLQANECFLALKTEHNDGHRYLQQASQMGASAAIVEHAAEDCSLPQLIVPNVLQAFQKIAFHYRQSLSTNIIAVTGSCGKTTLKELLAKLLGLDHTFKTPENFNNHLGVPFSLTRIDPQQHKHAVIEMGINQAQEMSNLARIVQPDASLLLNVGPVHIGNFNDSLTDLVAEKTSLFKFTKRDIFLPASLLDHYKIDFANNVLVHAMREEGTGPHQLKDDCINEVFYKLQAHSSGWLTSIRHKEKTYTFVIPFKIGRMSAYTFVMAIYFAITRDIPQELIQERLNTWRAYHQRGEWKHVDGQHYFVDCYNANPLSFVDSLQHFQNERPKGTACCYILGSMCELGKNSASYHRQVAKVISHNNNDYFILIGDFANEFKEGLLARGVPAGQIKTFSGVESALPLIRELRYNYFFLKGSHRYHLWDCVPKFAQNTIPSSRIAL